MDSTAERGFMTFGGVSDIFGHRVVRRHWIMPAAHSRNAEEVLAFKTPAKFIRAAQGCPKAGT